MSYLRGLQRKRIQLKADGQEFEVDLLPVRFFGDYLEILQWTAAQKLNAETLVEGRRKLRKLIGQIWDPRRIGLLNHFDYEGMANLARVLFFGEDNGTAAGKAVKEKIARNLDLELAAGRILHIFTGLGLEQLLDLSLPQFLELNTLALRIQADEALNIMIPAVGAGMGNKEIYASLHKMTEPPPERIDGQQEADYSQAEYDAAIARLKAVQQGKGKVIQAIRTGMSVPVGKGNR